MAFAYQQDIDGSAPTSLYSLTTVDGESVMCSFCGKTFYHRRSLTRHLRTVHRPVGSLKFECEQCLKVFSRRDNLSAHIKMKHSAIVVVPKTTELVVATTLNALPTSSSVLEVNHIQLSSSDAENSGMKKLKVEEDF